MKITRAYCPHCHSIRYTHNGYRQDSQGVIWHHRKCKSCTKTYKLEIEPPPPMEDAPKPVPPEVQALDRHVRSGKRRRRR
jgi:RNase P subunit RPR2